MKEKEMLNDEELGAIFGGGIDCVVVSGTLMPFFMRKISKHATKMPAYRKVDPKKFYNLNVKEWDDKDLIATLKKEGFALEKIEGAEGEYLVVQDISNLSAKIPIIPCRP